MKTIKAHFDGRVFVPCEAVNLRPGTAVGVLVPASTLPPTPEQEQEWQALLDRLAATEPAFSTVEEAMRYTRKRP